MNFKNKTFKEFLNENKQNLKELDDNEISDNVDETVEDSTNESNLEQQWFSYLKEKIKDDCNENGYYEVYWNYDDTLEPQTIKDAVEQAIEEGVTPSDILSDKLYEMNDDYDSYFINDIRKDIPDNLVEFADDRDIYDDLYANGYNGIDVNVKELIDRTRLNINVIFATPEEVNSDMSDIILCYGSWKSPSYGKIDTTDMDNCMTYLIHQQGHSVKEFYECLDKNPNGFGLDHKSTFIESCVDDCVNNTSDAMSAIAVLANVDANEYYELLKKDSEGYVGFNKSAYCGTFNPWAGSGGLSIELEKDVVFPKSYINRVQVEGADNSEYTVDEVFGLVNSCWDSTVDLNAGAPSLYQEDMEEVVSYINSLEEPSEEE